MTNNIIHMMRDIAFIIIEIFKSRGTEKENSMKYVRNSKITAVLLKD
jgi:hypothetical protein